MASRVAFRFDAAFSRAATVRLAALARQAPEAFGAALYQEANSVLADAIPITPVEFGALRRSGHVAPPVLAGPRVSVTLGFGGAAAPYAVYVHETPPPSGGHWAGPHYKGALMIPTRTARHAPPTQWKFLETPLKEHLRGMARRLAATVREGLAL